MMTKEDKNTPPTASLENIADLSNIDDLAFAVVCSHINSAEITQLFAVSVALHDKRKRFIKLLDSCLHNSDAFFLHIKEASPKSISGFIRHLQQRVLALPKDTKPSLKEKSTDKELIHYAVITDDINLIPQARLDKWLSENVTDDLNATIEMLKKNPFALNLLVIALVRQPTVTRNEQTIRVVLSKRNKLNQCDQAFLNLRGADLRGADLRGADLSRADLSRADLRGADLSGICLFEFYGSTQFDQHTKFSFDDAKKLPEFILTNCCNLPQTIVFVALHKLNIKTKNHPQLKEIQQCLIEEIKQLINQSGNANDKESLYNLAYNHKFFATPRDFVSARNHINSIGRFFGATRSVLETDAQHELRTWWETKASNSKASETDAVSSVTTKRHGR